METEPIPRESDPRRFLENRVYAKPGKRIPFDYGVFFAEEHYKHFDRLAIGTMTVTDMVTKDRYIDNSVWPYTEWELAREYLKWIFETQASPRTKRVGWNLETLNLLKVHQPLFFDRKKTGELVYLDISSAYWQIYARLTLDLYFNPFKQGFGLGDIRFLEPQWLRAQKTVRNAIIGISRSLEHHEYNPTGRESKGVRRTSPESPWMIRRSYNKFLAPELWGYIAFVLHHVADFLIQNYDVFYVHTDGYILPSDQAEDAIDAVMQRWGLSLSIKARGAGEVYGVGRWRIGNQGTKNYGPGEPVKYIMDTNPEISEWLSRMRRWSLSASPDDPFGN